MFSIQCQSKHMISGRWWKQTKMFFYGGNLNLHFTLSIKIQPILKFKLERFLFAEEKYIKLLRTAEWPKLRLKHLWVHSFGYFSPLCAHKIGSGTKFPLLRCLSEECRNCISLGGFASRQKEAHVTLLLGQSSKTSHRWQDFFPIDFFGPKKQQQKSTIPKPACWRDFLSIDDLGEYCCHSRKTKINKSENISPKATALREN